MMRGTLGVLRPAVPGVAGGVTTGGVGPDPGEFGIH